MIRHLLRVAGAGALILLALPAIAATANMEWVGTVGGANMGGYYVNPYQLTIDGTPTRALCDDFADEVAPPTQWQAEVYTYADIVNGKSTRMMSLGGLSDPLLAYRAAYYLATQLLAVPLPDDATRGQLSFALWDLMYPNHGVLSHISGTNLAQAGADKAAALAWAVSHEQAPELASLRIYSPIKDSGNAQNPTGYAQEMLVITPEPAAAAILAVDLFGALALVWVFRSRIRNRTQV